MRIRYFTVGLIAAVAWIGALVIFGMLLDSAGPSRTLGERTISIGYAAASLGLGITGLIMLSGRRIRLSLVCAIATAVTIAVAYGAAAWMARRSAAFILAASASVAIPGAIALGALAWWWTAGGGGARLLARLGRLGRRSKAAPRGLDAAFKLVFLIGGAVLLVGATVLTVLAVWYRIWEGVLVIAPWIYVGAGGILIGLRWGRTDDV
jgi:hypothetical protein